MFGNPDFSPKPVQWGGQQFADPAMLARWLRARGASPALWALRHPGAAQGLGMPMPQGAPAAQGYQDHPGAMQGPMPAMPGGAMQGAPPVMPPAGPVGAVPAMPPAEHPMGPGPPPNVLAALIAAIAGQAGSGVEPSGRVPSEGGMPHPVSVQQPPHYLFDLPEQLEARKNAPPVRPGWKLSDKARATLRPKRGAVRRRPF